MHCHKFIAALAATLLLAGCSGGPDDSETAAALGGAPPPDARAAGEPSQGERPAPPQATDKSAKPGGAPTPDSPPRTGGPAQPAQPATGSEPPPPSASAYTNPGTPPVVAGSNGDVTWQLYAFREDGATCVRFLDRGPAGTGGADACQKPPLNPSMASSANGRFGFGSASAKIAEVRFEHADGEREVFRTVAASGYAERFYAGEVARTPITRIVGLDSSGKVVAEKTDIAHYNQ